MKDRVSLHPGRIKLIPVEGQENTYDLERADEPVQEGTPLNKNSILKDTTAELFGMNEEALPDEVFAELSKAMDKIGTVVPTMSKNLENGYLWCDGSVVSKEEYPDLHKMLLPNGSEVVHTLSGKSTDYASKNPFLKHVNGYLITFYYYTLWYKADTENTWHSVDWYDIYNAYPYGFRPCGVVWDDTNNVFVFFVDHRNGKSSDYHTLRTYYTSDLSVLPTQTSNCSLSTTNRHFNPKKAGQYWIIRENGSYGYNNGDKFYYTEDLLNGTWQSIINITTGLHNGGADIVYAEGRYTVCGFVYNEELNTSYAAYYGWAYTDVGASIEGPWYSKLLPETGQEKFSYSSSQYNGFDHIFYMPKRKMFIMHSSSKTYYTYSITDSAYVMDSLDGSSGATEPSPNYYYDTYGALIEDVAYFKQGAIIDSENMKNKPVKVSCIPTSYPGAYLTDDFYYLGTNQILRLLKTTPDLSDATSGLQYKIKAQGVYK